MDTLAELAAAAPVPIEIGILLASMIRRCALDNRPVRVDELSAMPFPALVSLGQWLRCAAASPCA